MAYNLLAFDCVAVAVMDARCSQVYTALFKVKNTTIERLTDDLAVPISELKDFVSDFIFKYIDQEKIFFEDYKSAMKEYGDAEEVEISYEILDEHGVPHDKTFYISILIDGDEMGIGKGKNKKEANRRLPR